MSLYTIYCTNCGKSGIFPYVLSLIESHICDKCHHITENKTELYFCSEECLNEWNKNRLEKGIPLNDYLGYQWRMIIGARQHMWDKKEEDK